VEFYTMSFCKLICLVKNGPIYTREFGRIPNTPIILIMDYYFQQYLLISFQLVSLVKNHWSSAIHWAISIGSSYNGIMDHWFDCVNFGSYVHPRLIILMKFRPWVTTKVHTIKSMVHYTIITTSNANCSMGNDMNWKSSIVNLEWKCHYRSANWCSDILYGCQWTKNSRYDNNFIDYL
jgi:hypothetical protein